MNLENNVERKEGYNQVCVWPACVVTKADPPLTTEGFELFMKDSFGVDVQYLEEIETGPDLEDKKPVPDTGGRIDLFFSVVDKDVGIFAIPRLKVGIRWIEDVLAEGNYRSPIYPKRVFEYCTWNKENLAKF